MTIAIIVAVVVALVILVAFLALATWAGIPGSTVELIALAETTGASGASKMAQVVAQLADKIPAALRKVFSDARLQALAQSIFNWMRKYATAYNNAQQQAAPDATEAEISSDALAALVGELMGMTLSALQEKAQELGAELPEKSTKKQAAEAIIRVVLGE